MEAPHETSRSLFSDPQLNSLFLLTLGLAGILSGIYLFVRGFRLMMRKQLIGNTPTSTVRAAAIGPVEIHGKATGPYSLISPLSQVDCYYYEATAWQQVEDRNQKHWKKVAYEAMCVPFFIADETGSLMVDARGAELSLPPEFEAEIDTYATSESFRHFFARHGISSTATVKVKECVVKPEQALYVLGTLGENRGLGLSSEVRYADPQTRMLSSEAADLQRRIALDMMQVEIPGAGLPPLVPKQDFDLNPPVLLQKADQGLPFVIAAQSEQDLLETLSQTSALCLWGGPALILAGLAILIWRLTPH